ncbi:MAG TPA: hypothetical protein VHQ65_15275 [Thermoanaerobaculia bacterium]|nr:hypothetical protein [Thermoanaerobaculia bacterium]
MEATLHRLQADLDRRLAGYGIGESVSTSPHSLAARDSRVPRPLADDGRPMAAAPAPAPAAEPVVPAVPRPVEVHIGRLEIVTPGAAGQAGVPVATPAPPAEPLPDFSPWIALRSGTGWRGGR